MQALHFGAGNIGRGLIGSILSQNGFSLTFVDTNEDIIQQINEDGGYTVEILDDEKNQVFIDDVRAFNSLEDEDAIVAAFAEADLVTTSVGANNLGKIASIIKKSLLSNAEDSNTITLMANENIINATDILKDNIKKICSKREWAEFERITNFLNTTIDRQSMSRTTEGRNITMVEPYYEWVIEYKGENHVLRNLNDAVLVDDLKPYLERKLYIVNAEHAAFAYLGNLLGYKTIQQAGKDPLLLDFIHKYLHEISYYFIETYGMSPNEIKIYIMKTIKRHTNENLEDPIHRVARDPKRKLNVKDRLIAPMLKLEKMGQDNKMAKTVIAAGYLYRSE